MKQSELPDAMFSITLCRKGDDIKSSCTFHTLRNIKCKKWWDHVVWTQEMIEALSSNIKTGLPILWDTRQEAAKKIGNVIKSSAVVDGYELKLKVIVAITDAEALSSISLAGKFRSWVVADLSYELQPYKTMQGNAAIKLEVSKVAAVHGIYLGHIGLNMELPGFMGEELIRI